MKEKCVTFCFVKLNAKISPNLSEEGWRFCGEIRSLLSNLLTLFPAEAVAIK